MTLHSLYPRRILVHGPILWALAVVILTTLGVTSTPVELWADARVFSAANAGGTSTRTTGSTEVSWKVRGAILGRSASSTVRSPNPGNGAGSSFHMFGATPAATDAAKGPRPASANLPQGLLSAASLPAGSFSNPFISKRQPGTASAFSFSAVAADSKFISDLSTGANHPYSYSLIPAVRASEGPGSLRTSSTKKLPDGSRRPLASGEQPGLLVLFGSGMLFLAGILRVKLNAREQVPPRRAAPAPSKPSLEKGSACDLFSRLAADTEAPPANPVLD